MNDNDFENIEYHGAQVALKNKMNSKLWEAEKLVQKASHEDFALVMEMTTNAMNLLLDVQNLYRRVCGNKAKRAGDQK